MPNLDTGSKFRQLRARKGWQQQQLAESLEKYRPNIHRLEAGEKLPSLDAIDEVLYALDAPTDEFIYSAIETEDMATHALRHSLLSALERKSLDEAIPIYNQMAAIEGFKDNPVNHQFLLSQEARILEQQGQPADTIMPLVIQGLNKTYEELNDTSPGATVLIYEEPELFHTLARCHAMSGNYPTAKRILVDTVNGLQQLSTGERIRDRHITPMVQTLAEYQFATEDYEGLMKTYELGIDLSALRSAGRRVPQFLNHKATVLFKQGQAEAAARLLREAYVLHILMGDKDSANKVLDRAANEFGIGFKTYGIENLDVPAVAPKSFARGDIPSCKTIGEMIYILRDKAKLIQQRLCQGICSVPTLSKIETTGKKRMPSNLFHIEPLLQRLGRDPHLYCNFFLRRDDFKAVELRDTIHLLLNHGKYAEAEEALAKLKTYKAYSRKATNASLQFLRRAEASIFAIKNKMHHPEVKDKILEALHLTCPNFDENGIAGCPLTIDEVLLIRTLANHYASLTGKDNLIKALKIYRALIENINQRYTDERDKARIYIPVMFRLSSCLGRLDMHDEALKVAEEAIEFCQSRGRLSPLTELIYNKAFSMYKLGYEKESLPYFALAYYGFQAFKTYGRGRYIETIEKNVSAFFGIQFD